MAGSTGVNTNHINSFGADGLLPGLAATMKVDLLINTNNDVFLLHDRPLAADLDWIEYDQGTNHLVLMFTDGQMQELGMVIPPMMGDLLMKGGQVTFIYMNNGVKERFFTAPLMVRQDLVN